MDCAYQERVELEDDLYREDDGDSECSEADSEMEFRLYSQLHYSSNAGELAEQEEQEEQEDGGETTEGQVTEGQDRQLQVETEKTHDADEEELELSGGESGPQSPELQQPLKKKKQKKAGEKCVKKKENSKAKGQSSSSVFEEVIVIDSSTDVISISEDDTAEDDGICSVKGQSSHRLQTSTPVQGGQKKKRNITAQLTVDSSSSDSEESASEAESSDSSDSEYLESWMILGREKQAEDRSISLNLEGGSDGNTDAEDEEEESSWLVSDKDKEAQIINRDKGARTPMPRVANRYYTNKSVQCRNCNKYGHLSKNCPEPKKLSSCHLCGTPGHMSVECPSKHCSNCGLPGHLYASCSERPYWHKQCHRCNMKGHFFDACPEIWRQYHITTRAGPPVALQQEDDGRSPAFCHNCSRKGHFGHACTRPRMFNGVFVSAPFINHYDTKEDMNRRQHRVRLKVKDLKKNGCFSDTCPTPLTPGPPRKRHKFSHPRSDGQNHGATMRQTPNNHRPRNTHTFFPDDDLTGKTPKTKKSNKLKPPQSAGNVKPWKPKRPVAKTRDPRPPPKIIFNEADDFPRGGGGGKGGGGRGGGRGDNARSKKKIKGAGPKPENSKQRRSQARRVAGRKAAAQMYPSDENLFIIKQRKRKR